jgi:hypothetical protein
MAIHSSFLGPVTVTGDDAKSLQREITNGRGTKAAAVSAARGRKLVASFDQKGAVAIKLNKRA